jgi:hypothetical protein
MHRITKSPGVMLKARTPVITGIMRFSFQTPALIAIGVCQVVHAPVVFAATLPGFNVRDLAGSPLLRWWHQSTHLEEMTRGLFRGQSDNSLAPHLQG